MLVLGVKEGDYVMIGEDIMIRVMEVDNQFRLAFDAPADVTIRRSSLCGGQRPAPPKGKTGPGKRARA